MNNRASFAGGVSLPGIDIGAGMEYVADDEAFYRMLLGRYYASHARAVAEMAEHAAAERWFELKRRAHTLCGSSATIGAKDVAAAARAYEEALKTDNAASVAQLAAALGLVLGGLADFLGHAQPSPEQQAADGATAAEAKARLLAMLAAFDGDANEYFAQSKDVLSTVLSAGAMARLADCLQKYDFVGAMSALD